MKTKTNYISHCTGHRFWGPAMDLFFGYFHWLGWGSTIHEIIIVTKGKEKLPVNANSSLFNSLFGFLSFKKTVEKFCSLVALLLESARNSRTWCNVILNKKGKWLALAGVTGEAMPWRLRFWLVKPYQSAVGKMEIRVTELLNHFLGFKNKGIFHSSTFSALICSFVASQKLSARARLNT